MNFLPFGANETVINTTGSRNPSYNYGQQTINNRNENDNNKNHKRLMFTPIIVHEYSWLS